MEINTLYKLKQDVKMHKILRENSEWYKELNRNANNYDKFLKYMKKKYRLGITDRISDTIDNLDLVTNVIANIK